MSNANQNETGYRHRGGESQDNPAARGIGRGVKAGRHAALLVALTICYFFFTGSFSVNEALAACPAVLAGFGFAWAGAPAGLPMRLGGSWRWLPVLFWRLFLALPRDCWLVGRVLLRSLVWPVAGEMVRQAFVHDDSAESDGTNRGRRAAVILAASLAPNGYVVRVPAEGNFMLLHRLAAAPLAADTLWPV